MVCVKNPQRAFNHPKGHSFGLRIEWSMLSQTTSAFEEQVLYFLKQGGMQHHLSGKLLQTKLSPLI